MIVVVSHAQKQNDTKLKIKGLKKKFQSIANQEKAGKATSVSHKMYFKAKSSFRRN